MKTIEEVAKEYCKTLPKEQAEQVQQCIDSGFYDYIYKLWLSEITGSQEKESNYDN